MQEAFDCDTVYPAFSAVKLQRAHGSKYAGEAHAQKISQLAYLCLALSDATYLWPAASTG